LAEYRAIRKALAPLGAAYGAVMSLRNFCYDRSLVPVYRSALPVICAGNAVAGGSGKSPFVDYLAARLLAQGMPPVILSRGYRGRLRGPHLVQSSDCAADVGDEALMHGEAAESSGVNVPVVIARDRCAGARFIEEHNLGRVILLDDGFQHRRLARDLNVLLLDCSSPEAATKWSDAKMLPAGYLREHLQEALRRAHCLVLVRRSAAPQPSYPAWVEHASFPANLPVFHLSLVPGALIDLFSGEPLPLDSLRGVQACAACAIAAPAAFFALLSELGIIIKQSFSYPDHYLFTPRDFARWRAGPDSPLVVTLKDAVKLKRFVTAKGTAFALQLLPSFDQDEEKLLWELIEKNISQKNKG